MADRIANTDWCQFAPYMALNVDFQAVLRNVIALNAETRTAARRFLEEWPYEGYGGLGAVPDVVRVLLELLERYPDYGDKVDLLQVIIEFATHAPEYVAFRNWYAGEPSVLLASIRSAFAQGFRLYCAALSDPDAHLRVAAAEALALFSSSDSGPLLASQLRKESSPEVCQAILLSVGKVRAESALPDVSRLTTSPNRKTRLRAAYALSRIVSPLPTHAVYTLADYAMLGTQADRKATPDEAQDDNDLAVEAGALLSELGDEALFVAAERWIAGMNTVGDDHLLPYVHRLLAWTVRQSRERVPPSHLTRLERRVLGALAQCNSYWTTAAYPLRPPGLQSEVIIDAAQTRSHHLGTLYGLPDTQHGLTEFLDKVE